jgi:hypothetical protein
VLLVRRGPDAVIKYFARYTKKIGLSDSRVTAYDGKDVTYAYRDRQDGNRVKPARLEGPKFCQRFLNQTLPPSPLFSETPSSVRRHALMFR